ncbi:hypothetical protein MANY_26220 [Mycolicibacterium anyangense]|uniref:HTH tetR-type domain-containing protein n=1 Tax=Mycolicibacterium anyangense TaxID=1431246 RepID=A0A6N4W947_9MYCO|nr:TetR/AcrR family transcriptional regulator [Mycolicibacterium anyangense]BBZ77285.1 hypothetical protein MANY_26220 [Mycolicibacterium anyangense]
MRASSRPRRADARIARERILAAAVSVLGTEPLVSLERVAQLAGVHRATVYRHFPSREHLIEAVVEQALVEGRDVVDRTARHPVGEKAVYVLAAETTQYEDRYSFLIGLPEVAAAGPDPIGLSALMQSWQEHDVLRDDMSPQWLAATFVALAQALLAPGAVLPGQLPHEVLAAMFLRGASASD